MSTPPPAPLHPRGPSFLSLPAELRLWIYEAALAPTLELAADPWTKFPPWSRFSVLLTLALTSRQVGAEATALFYKKFAPRARLYFEDAVKLHDFYMWVIGKGERVRRLKVLLRIDSGSSCVDDEDFHWEWEPYRSRRPIDADTLRLDALELLWQQPAPGDEDIWTMQEFQGGWGPMFRIPLPEIGSDGLWVNELWPDCGLEKRYHRSQRMAGGIGRHNSMTWPALGAGLELTTHVCIDKDCTVRENGFPNYHNATLEMEGELWAINFFQFELAGKRGGRYHCSKRFFDNDDSWKGWGNYLQDDEAEWANDEPLSEFDSWAPSSWYASDSGESYCSPDKAKREEARELEET